MNTMKRISRNSIALFSFTGRSKKQEDKTPAKGSNVQKSRSRGKSSRAKGTKEPKIGKLDFDMAITTALENYRSNAGPAGGADCFEDSIESLQRRIDS